MTPSMDRKIKGGVCVTAGRISVPPSYFIIDHLRAISDQVTASLHGQIVAIRDDTGITGLPSTGRKTALAVFRQLMKREPDIIHQHWATWSLPAVVASRCLNIPLIVTLHGYDAFLPRTPGRVGRIVDLRKRLERKFALRCATSVVVHSSFMASRAVFLGVPKQKVVLVRHAIDTTYFAPPKAERRRGIAYVGRLSPEKGVDLLLEAVAGLPDETYQFLTIAGEGTERQALQRKAEALGVRCEFVGQLPSDEVRNILQSVMVVVSPSRPARGQIEASGLIPLEAQSCGAAVVVTSVGGLAENLPTSCTELVAEPTVVDLRRAILVALGDKAAQLRKAGRQHVLMHHDDKFVGSKYLDIYRGLNGGEVYSKRRGTSL